APLRDRYIVSALVEEAITSSQLEGAATTRDVAKRMLREGRAPRDRSERMIANNYRAMERVRQLVGQPLTASIVNELHRIVTEGTLRDPADAGRMQTDDAHRVVVASSDEEVLHRPPPAGQLRHRMEALCAFANGTDDGPYLPGVLRAIAVHFMTGYDHFFVDGNGRLARTLFYWTMLNNGYWLTQFLTISTILHKAPAQYGRAYLYTEQDDGDLTYFFLYHLSVLRRAIDGLRGYLDRKTAELRQTRQALTGSFNERQLAIMGAAMAGSASSFTAQGVARQFGVTVQTARADLTDLCDRGLLLMDASTRQHTWTPAADLSQRLVATELPLIYPRQARVNEL
ncbi:MAG: Fic family protein, partial [Propionibacteriaceae bacterium]|nr:Fic family protein [Propionibacteriaceae bacterium]